jgi:hypothetical protein
MRCTLIATMIETGAGEEINHIAGPTRGKPEIIRLDQHQRALRRFARQDTLTFSSKPPSASEYFAQSLSLTIGFFDIRGRQVPQVQSNEPATSSS